MNPHLVSYRDGKRDLTFPLVDSGTLIGRDAGCFVQLTDKRISKRHAIIKKQGDEWIVEDLGSRNGVCVNREKIKHATLRDGDRISFGPIAFEFLTHPFTDGSFVPNHVIDLSSRAEQQTMPGNSPDDSES